MLFVVCGLSLGVCCWLFAVVGYVLVAMFRHFVLQLVLSRIGFTIVVVVAAVMVIVVRTVIATIPVSVNTVVVVAPLVCNILRRCHCHYVLDLGAPGH